MQQTAAHCNALQHTATHCNTQHAATHCNTLQHTATHCNTLQRTATRNTLQHTATHCSTHGHLTCTQGRCHKKRPARAAPPPSAIQAAACRWFALCSHPSHTPVRTWWQPAKNKYIYIYIYLFCKPKKICKNSNQKNANAGQKKGHSGMYAGLGSSPKKKDFHDTNGDSQFRLPK